MDTRFDNIRKLLDRYYDGLTSQAEEEALRRFFREQTSVPAQMEADRRMFAALDREADGIAAPEGLEKRILGAIDATEAALSRSLWHKRLRIWSAAACIAAIAVTTALLSLPRLRDAGATDPATGAALALTISIPDEPPARYAGKVTAAAAEPSPSPKPHLRHSRRAARPAAEPPLEALTDEEMLALEAGLKALAIARDKIAYASECAAAAGERVRDINAEIRTILP